MLVDVYDTMKYLARQFTEYWPNVHEAELLDVPVPDLYVSVADVVRVGWGEAGDGGGRPRRPDWVSLPPLTL